MCTGLKSVEIPESLTYIDDWTFNGCSSLTAVNIPCSVTTIGANAFSECSGLASIIIPNSVNRIEELAFADCTELRSLAIPKSVTFIGDIAFIDCNKIEVINYDCVDPIPSYRDIFSDVVYEKATLNVAIGGLEKARSTDPWKNFRNIQEKDFSGVEEIVADFDANVPIEVYDIHGIKQVDTVDNLPAGTYIIRQGNKSKKIVVK